MVTNLNEIIRSLSRTPLLLRTMLTDIPNDLVHANEGQNTWSAFDILGHLIHGENTDWIPRTKIILSDQQDKNFPVFDRFAQEKISIGKTMQDLISEFANLREDNLNKLKSLNLTTNDLEKTGIHPEFGDVKLREHLSSWMVHDLNHLSQINRIFCKKVSGKCWAMESLFKDS